MSPVTSEHHSTSEILAVAEETGQVIRALGGALDSAPFDPLDALEELDVQLLWSEDVNSSAGVPPESPISAKTWSGTSWPSPPGHPQRVLLNSDQTIERARVTLLEEVAHRLLGHRPTSITPGEGRTYSELNEKQAYWAGAAALLPPEVVARAVWQGESAADLASRYGVSTELAEMRIKLLGLWREHKQNLQLSPQSK